MQRLAAERDGDRMGLLRVETAEIELLIAEPVGRKFDLPGEFLPGSLYRDFAGERRGKSVAEQIFRRHLFAGAPAELAVNRFGGERSEIFRQFFEIHLDIVEEDLPSGRAGEPHHQPVNGEGMASGDLLFRKGDEDFAPAVAGGGYISSTDQLSVAQLEISRKAGVETAWIDLQANAFRIFVQLLEKDAVVAHAELGFPSRGVEGELCAVSVGTRSVRKAAAAAPVDVFLRILGASHVLPGRDGRKIVQHHPGRRLRGCGGRRQAAEQQPLEFEKF